MLCAVPEATAGESVERLSQVWRDFAENECGSYSPLYAAICHSVAGDPELLALAASVPPPGQQPNVMLAAAHYLLLSGIVHPLADVYAGRSDPGLAPALFRDLCLSQRYNVGRMLATRHTQTNEPGRAALLAAGLATAARDGTPTISTTIPATTTATSNARNRRPITTPKAPRRVPTAYRCCPDWRSDLAALA